MVFLEFVKEKSGSLVRNLKLADQLEQVLIGKDVAAVLGVFAHQVINRWRSQPLLAHQQILVSRRIGTGVGFVGVAKPDLVDRSFKQRIKRRGYEKVKIGDLGELPQWFRMG